MFYWIAPSGPGPPLSWHHCQQRARVSLSHPGGQPPPQPQQHRHPPCRHRRRQQETAATQEKRLLHLRSGHNKTTPGLPDQVCWAWDDTKKKSLTVLVFCTFSPHGNDFVLSFQLTLQCPQERHSLTQVEQQHYAGWRLSGEVWLWGVRLFPLWLSAGFGTRPEKDCHSHAGW